MVNYKQGDIIVMDFNPQQGHEQSGRRPAIVLSNDILNNHSSMALCDQAKMLDVKARNAQFKEACPDDIWNEAKELVISFM